MSKKTKPSLKVGQRVELGDLVGTVKEIDRTPPERRAVEGAGTVLVKLADKDAAIPVVSVDLDALEPTLQDAT